jgi:hypothetical protein
MCFGSFLLGPYRRSNHFAGLSWNVLLTWRAGNWYIGSETADRAAAIVSGFALGRSITMRKVMEARSSQDRPVYVSCGLPWTYGSISLITCFDTELTNSLKDFLDREPSASLHNISIV